MTLDQRVHQLKAQVEVLAEEAVQCRRVVAQLIGSHNYFVSGQGFFGRLKWLLLGPPKPKASPLPDEKR